MTPNSRSPEDVVRAFVDAINRQNVEELARLMPEDHLFIDPLGAAVRGWDAMKAGWTHYFRMVPDYSIAIEETYAAGEIVILLGAARGTYADGGEIRPENRWSTPAAWRAKVRGGQVAEWRVYADNEPLRQLMRRPHPAV